MSLPVVVLVMSQGHTEQIVGTEPATLASIMALVETEVILAAFRSEGDWSAAARALGMTRPGLYKKRKRLGLE